jgi:hypothetical protein
VTAIVNKNEAFAHPVRTFFKQDDLERRFATRQLRRELSSHHGRLLPGCDLSCIRRERPGLSRDAHVFM